MKLLTRIACCAFVFVATLAALVAPARAEVAPSLQGEHFSGQSGIQESVQASCNPTGNSTVSFTVSGFAGPPYPGTFKETVMVTIGPQTNVGAGPLGLNAGPILMAHASFTIDSAAGQVSGSKDLLAGGASQGTCVTALTESET